jgi:hypothetical protein
LKDDPPPVGVTILVINANVGGGWTFMQFGDANALSRHDRYTHWLPMPPDPTKPKNPHLDSYGQYCYHHPNSQYHDEIAFKSGWNAALEQVCTFRGFNLSSEQYVLWEQFLNKLQAP